MIIWLASYPRSGNTLVRMLLRSVFGVTSCSKYDDITDIGANPATREAVGHVFLDEPWPSAYQRMTASEETSFVKTHDPPDDSEKTIYVVRDGRNVCKSFFHYLQDYAAEDFPFTVSDAIAGFTPFGSWSAHLDCWQPQARPNTLLLHFEDMVRSPNEAIASIAGFTGLEPLQAWNKDFQALHELNPRFFRQGNVEYQNGDLSDEEMELFWSCHADWMERLGYPLPQNRPPCVSPRLRQWTAARTSELFTVKQRINSFRSRTSERQDTAASQDGRSELETILRRHTDFLDRTDGEADAYIRTVCENRRLQEVLFATKSESRQRLSVIEEYGGKIIALEQILEQKAAQESAREEKVRQLSRLVQEREAEIASIHDDGFGWLLRTTTTRQPALHFCETNEPGLVSVVIPAYNVEEFLEESVQSVWKQEGRGFHMELIICEDGSTKDRTFELAQTLVARSPVPARVLTHEGRKNHGVSATRNLGLAAARGEYVALLDADDIWLPEKLAVQTQFMKDHPETPCVCSYGTNRDLDGEPMVGWNGTETAGDYRNAPPPHNFDAPYTFEDLRRGDPIVNSTILIRRNALEAVGGYPRLMAHQAEDWLLLAKIALLAPIQLIPEKLIDYTIHPQAYTARYAACGYAYGSRIEFLFHLVHWMLHSPRYREQGELLFRHELPALMSTRPVAHQMIENYLRHHNGHVHDIAQFEAHMSGLYAELDRLRQYVNEHERMMGLLRRIPGLRKTYKLLKSAYGMFKTNSALVMGTPAKKR